MRRNSVNVEDGILPPEGLVRRNKPEKLFLRSASVGLAPGDGELSPSPGPTAKSPDDKKQNRRESIKGHLMKFKAKAGKILEEKQSKLTVQEEPSNLSFVSATESELREELSVVDESEPSIQESRKESKEQLRHRIRKSAQKAVERTRGNVQLSRRLARRPTVVMEEHLDENDLSAIDEQVERTIKMGEKYLVANDDTIKHQKDIDSFFEEVPKIDNPDKPPQKIIYGRIKGVKYQEEGVIKHVQSQTKLKIFDELVTQEVLRRALRPPTRVEYSDDSVSIYTAPEHVESSESREKNKKYVQLDVFIDSIHFDHHYLWGAEEVAAAEFRNEHLVQTLRMYETKLAVINPEKKPEDIEKLVELKESVRLGRLELERLADVLKETRRSQGYTATRVDYTPAEHPWDVDDWSACGKITHSSTVTPMGRIPKECRQRVLALNKTEIQLILYFNDMEVAKTKWIPLSSDLMGVVRRFELEFYSQVKSLTLMVMEKFNKSIRMLGKGNVPLPKDEDEEIALMEVEFENDEFLPSKFGSLGSNAERKEGGRILCRTILEDGELRLAEERLQVESAMERKNKPFELIPSHLVLGGGFNEDEDKKRLEELREEDRAQKRFAYRSAIDSRRISALQFANLARKKVMDRRQRREKKYEEIVKEVSIPTLSVAFSQLFGPADVSRKLKPMRKEERHREEGWDNTIILNIQSATNLPVRNSGQLQPFVTATFAGKRISTDVAMGRHPNWQFTGKLIVPKEDQGAEFIEFRIYDQIVEEIDKDDRLANVVHEQLAARLLASQRIRFETLATAAKINAPIHLTTPLHISGYQISPEASFLKVLLSTQIDPKSQVEYTKSPSSMETPKTLEKCSNVEKTFRQMYPERLFRPLVTDLNAHLTVCTRYLRPINPPSLVMQESNLEKIVKLAARVVAGIPRVDATAHSDIWGNGFQLTSIAAGGLEERATLLACWLLHFKLPVAVVLGEARGEKTGFVLTELESKQVLIDPEDGHIYGVLDTNCGLEKIYGAFDVKNYYGNIQMYEHAHQIAFQFTKFPHWKALFAPGEELLETVQPAHIQYVKVSEDWIVELRIALEREIKLRFDESRKHAIPQWHLVAARQLREVLEGSRGANLAVMVEEKMARLKDGYGITVVVMRMYYGSMGECVQEVLAARLQDSPEDNVQFALAVNVVDFFAHVIEVEVAVAVLRPRK